MNKNLIYDLVDQAVKDVDIVGRDDLIDQELEKMYIPNCFAERFAELIVKECAQLCRDQPNLYAMKADRDNCAIAIEEHFGVEE